MSPRIVPVDPHGPLVEVLPGLHLVQGSLRFGPARFSRNMVVIVRGEALTLVNSVRLDDGGLAQLETLGEVSHVLRLAGAHGRDDPFYKRRYGAQVWDLKDMRYFEGMDFRKGATYFESDTQLSGAEFPPIPGARLFHFGTTPGEGALLLPDAGGTLIPGDALHNWVGGKDHFNWMARLGFGVLGFVGPHKFGKGWLDHMRPDPAGLRAVLETGFENILPAHGDPTLGGAAGCYSRAMAAYEARASRRG
jgi:hypothetical protein